MKKIYNENGKDNGLIFSAYKQSGSWIVNITSDDTDCWHEKHLHYSYTTKKDVLEWIRSYMSEMQMDDYKYEVRF